jgi:hypothetical protein
MPLTEVPLRYESSNNKKEEEITIFTDNLNRADSEE